MHLGILQQSGDTVEVYSVACTMFWRNLGSSNKGNEDTLEMDRQYGETEI